MDNSSGIAGIWYTLNDAKEQVYSTPLMFKDEGNFSMVIRLQDNVGNSSSETLRFVIKDWDQPVEDKSWAKTVMRLCLR